MRDYGAVHRRVAPGFVVDAQLEGMDRLVTFASGAIARERLVSLDDDRRRLVYKVVEGRLPFEHHQGSVEVIESGPQEPGSRIVWTTDFLPEELGAPLGVLMNEGAVAISRAFSD
jgi:hypothetical protein